MTLRGSFSELPLAEVLQLATNSGNTAVLEISSGRGSAWIGIADGEVVRIARSDVPLGAAGIPPESEPQKLQRHLQLSARQALLDLFEWRDGEFELDTFADPRGAWKGPEGITLDPPLHPQALALDAARLYDERQRSGRREALLAGSGSEVPMNEILKLAMASGNTAVLRVWSSHGSAWIGLEAGELMRLARSDLSLAAEDLLQLAPASVTRDPEQSAAYLRSEAAKALLEIFDWNDGGFELDIFAKPREPWGGPEGITLDPPLSPDELTGGAAPATTAPREPSPEREQPDPAPTCAVIAMSTDLQFLEDLKMAIAENRMRVHLHQLSEDAIRRVGHYLVKGLVPLVVIDDRQGGSAGPAWQSAVGRIRALSARVCIVRLRRSSPADGALQAGRPRPRVSQERLRTALLPFLKVQSPEAQRNIASRSES